MSPKAIGVTGRAKGFFLSVIHLQNLSDSKAPLRGVSQLDLSDLFSFPAKSDSGTAQRTKQAIPLVMYLNLRAFLGTWLSCHVSTSFFISPDTSLIFSIPYNDHLKYHPQKG